jgi:hypothetical protein
MGTPIVCTNFSSHQIHREFKPNIGNDPFQPVSNQGPNDCEEETADDGDELEGVDGLGRIWKMDVKMIILRCPDLHKRQRVPTYNK